MNRRYAETLALLFFLVGITGNAGAAVIFSDDFNQSDSSVVGNGWTPEPGPDRTTGFTRGVVRA